MIYAIRVVGTEYVKFGFTKDKNPRNRVDAMQTGCPFELKLVAFGPGDRVAEQWIHLRLKRIRAHHRGEWFKQCPEVEKIIWEIREISEGRIEPANNELVAYLPERKKTGERLGRIIEYAKRISAANSSEETARQSASREA